MRDVSLPARTRIRSSSGYRSCRGFGWNLTVCGMNPFFVTRIFQRMPSYTSRRNDPSSAVCVSNPAGLYPDRRARNGAATPELHCSPRQDAGAPWEEAARRCPTGTPNGFPRLCRCGRGPLELGSLLLHLSYDVLLKEPVPIQILKDPHRVKLVEPCGRRGRVAAETALRYGGSPRRADLRSRIRRTPRSRSPLARRTLR